MQLATNKDRINVNSPALVYYSNNNLMVLTMVFIIIGVLGGPQTRSGLTKKSVYLYTTGTMDSGF